MRIQFSPPDIGEQEINSVAEVLRSGWITTGPKTKLFENEIAAYCGTKKAVCLNSATACLELTLRLLGIGAGDEVITSAYTYTASASVIHHVGAKIVLVDTAPGSYFLDYTEVEKKITPRTKAIIPVDIAGVMCNYAKLLSIAEANKSIFKPSSPMQESLGRIAVIADAAHSFGSISNSIVSGGAADFTCFSFHAVKNLTTAEGGAVTWRDMQGISNEKIYKEFMLMSLHGQSKDALAKTQLGSWEYDIVAPYYKCNMTDIMSAIGLAQLARYNKILARRHEIIQLYDAGFANADIDVLKHYGESFSSCGHLYLTRIKEASEQKRNECIIKLAEKGVATNVHYKPLPMHTAYKNVGFSICDYPNAQAQYQNEITLPLHTLLTNEDVAFVIESVLEICNV